eukprot:1104232_1
MIFLLLLLRKCNLIMERIATKPMSTIPMLLKMMMFSNTDQKLSPKIKAIRSYLKYGSEIKVNEGDVGKYNDCASVPGASAVYDVRLNGRGQYYKGIVYEKGKDFVFDLDLDYFKKYVFDLDSDDFSNYKCQSRNKPWRNSKTDSVAGKLLDKLYQEPKMPKH